MSHRYRNVVFTLNNPLSPVLFDETTMEYLIYQLELGEKGTPHYQGYVELKGQYGIKRIKEILGSTAFHIENRRGTQLEAIDYCRKEETRKDGPWTFGRPKGENVGRTTGYKDFKDQLELGKTCLEIASQDANAFGVFIRYRNGLNAYQEYISRNKTKLRRYRPSTFTQPFNDWSDNKTLLVVGKSGMGKTEWAKAHFDNPLFVSHFDDLIHFNKNVHDGIIFDDVKFCQRGLTGVIAVVDNDNPRSIHVRHVTAPIPMNTKKIITLNSIEDFWPEDLALTERAPIERRIKIVFVDAPIFDASKNDGKEEDFVSSEDVTMLMEVSKPIEREEVESIEEEVENIGNDINWKKRKHITMEGDDYIEDA